MIEQAGGSTRAKVRGKKRYLFRLGLLTTLLSACTGPHVTYQQPTMNIPSQWTLTHDITPVEQKRLKTWWQQFHDPLLEQLVAEALHANLNLAQARAQVRQARAQRDLAAAELGPSVDVSASASRSKSSKQSGSGQTSELYNAGFDASWEADVFGRLNYAAQAAQADLQASQDTLYGTQVSLVAEVALTYVELRTVQARLHLAQSNLNALSQSYQITRWRNDAGLVSALDVAQARTELESTKAEIPQLQNSITQYINALALLLGQTPGDIKSRLTSGTSIPHISERLAVGIPADTLRNRPDVRAAQNALVAQTTRLGAAEAARYPSFKLSGSLGLQALTLGTLDNSDALTHSLLASVTAPIFDSGRIKANIAAQDALLEQKRLAYQSSVLTAIKDVENALVNIQNTTERLTRLQSAISSARETLGIAEYRYDSGLVDFVSVLDSQRTLFGLQDQLASAQGDVAAAYIQLYKALGGGWTVEKVGAGNERDK